MNSKQMYTCADK